MKPALGAKIYVSLRFWITYNFEFDNFKQAERMLKSGQRKSHFKFSVNNDCK